MAVAKLTSEAPSQREAAPAEYVEYDGQAVTNQDGDVVSECRARALSRALPLPLLLLLLLPLLLFLLFLLQRLPQLLLLQRLLSLNV